MVLARLFGVCLMLPFFMVGVFALAFRSDYFFEHYFFLSFAFGIAAAWQLRKAYRLPFCLAAGYFAASSIVTLGMDGTGKQYVTSLMVGLVAGGTLMISSVVTHWTLDDSYKPALKWLSVAQVGLALTHVGVSDGFFDNASVSSSLSAILAPHLPWYLWPVLGFSLFHQSATSGRLGNTPLAILAVYAVLYVAKRYRRLVPLALGVPALAVLYALTWGDHQYSDRFGIWSAAVRYWWTDDWTHRLFGFGVGSFFSKGPELQTIAKGIATFSTAHNDWVQLLFERGLVGLILFAWVAVSSFLADWRAGRFELAYSQAGIAVFAAFFFPLEMPIFCFLWIFLLQRGQKKRPPSFRQAAL